MKKRKTIAGQGGFTLIETLIAMAIFTIGILGLFGMQSAVIKKNLSANNITSGATWAAYQVERIITRNYKDLPVTGNCDSLADWQALPKPESANSTSSAASGSTVLPIYTVYWAVAKNCSLIELRDATDVGTTALERKPKHVRITVTRKNSVNVNAQEAVVSVFDYIKQNTN